MTILKNYRHERYALGIYKGMCQRDAAIYAGYKMTRARCTGYRLATYGHIQKRLEELGAITEIVTVMAKTEVMERLSEIGRARLIDFLEGEEPKLNENIENNGAAAEFSIRHSSNKQGEPVITKSIKLHNPITAMAELSKLRGDYAPVKVGIEPDSVLGELLAGLLGRLRGYNKPELPEGNGDKEDK